MKPSAASTSSRRVRSLELGDWIFDNPRYCPLRMRVNRSPMGSVIIALPSSPARFGHAGDLAEIRQIAQRDTRQLGLAVEALRTAGQFAAMVDTHLRGIARQLRELEARVEAFFRRNLHVFRNRLQRGALGSILRDHLLALLVPVDLARFCHFVLNS